VPRSQVCAGFWARETVYRAELMGMSWPLLAAISGAAVARQTGRERQQPGKVSRNAEPIRDRE